MVFIEEVRTGFRPLKQFGRIVGSESLREVLDIGEGLSQRFQGRVVWNVNSTAVGGGVAEMLRPLLSYCRGAGVDTRWMVITGNTDFFRITKRLHHALHGSPGDGTPLDGEAHRIYEDTLRENSQELCSLVRPRDIVILHDPQTAGLAGDLIRHGALVLWRCHIGHDTTNDEVESGWHFLEPYLEPIPVFVFSRDAYVPAFCDHGKSTIIQPSIDAFAPKNQEMDESTVREILVNTGLLDCPRIEGASTGFLRHDGTPGRVERVADVVRLGRAPHPDTPLVVQVSRWDPLKDMIGVMHGFARHVHDGWEREPELVLAGPNAKAVADDPEGVTVFDEVEAAWRELPDPIRMRVHLASLPTDDVEENAAIVNALQRHASVVVQKSLHEGFGLTVTEAMWKARPVVASAVGGIQDQIEDGVSGVLLKDPNDLEAFGAALTAILADPERARRMGEAARERVREHFLGIRHLLQYAQLIERMDAEIA